MKHAKRPRDVNKWATSSVALAAGQSSENESVAPSSEPTLDERHVAATILGRKGGQIRASKLTPEQRHEIAKRAAKARWGKS